MFFSLVGLGTEDVTCRPWEPTVCHTGPEPPLGSSAWGPATVQAHSPRCTTSKGMCTFQLQPTATKYLVYIGITMFCDERMSSE